MSARRIRSGGGAAPTGRSRMLGMSLTEVLVSMTIFAIGVLGLMNAHGFAFASYSDARHRVDAALLADRLIGSLWVDRVHAPEYQYAGGGNNVPARLGPWLAQVQQSLPTADAVVAVAGSEVSVTVTWRPRNGDLHSHVAVATLQDP
jgi:type IV pilus assembly protein PilV